MSDCTRPPSRRTDIHFTIEDGRKVVIIETRHGKLVFEPKSLGDGDSSWEEAHAAKRQLELIRGLNHHDHPDGVVQDMRNRVELNLGMGQYEIICEVLRAIAEFYNLIKADDSPSVVLPDGILEVEVEDA